MTIRSTAASSIGGKWMLNVGLYVVDMSMLYVLPVFSDMLMLLLLVLTVVSMSGLI